MKTYLVNLNEIEMESLVNAPELDGFNNGTEARHAYISAKAKLVKILQQKREYNKMEQ